MIANHPAFPNSGSGVPLMDGMSLRDWFAGQSLLVLAGTWTNSDETVEVNAYKMALFAYAVADAMLFRRSLEYNPARKVCKHCGCDRVNFDPFAEGDESPETCEECGKAWEPVVE